MAMPHIRDIIFICKVYVFVILLPPKPFKALVLRTLLVWIVHHFFPAVNTFSKIPGAE